MATTNVADLNLDEDQDAETITPGTSRAVSTYVGEATPDVQGEITQADLRLPRINVGQKTGELGEQFSFGGIILAKEIQLAKIGEIVSDVTVMKIRKQYQEKLPFEANRAEPPRTFETAKAVMDAGLSINFGDEGYCERIAHMLLLVPAIDGLDEEELDSFFYHSFASRRYCAALFTATGTNFTEAGKSVLTAASKPDCVTNTIRLAKWNLEAIKKTGRGNTWYALKMVRAGNNSPEFIEFSKTVAP